MNKHEKKYQKISQIIQDKRILITGGTGTIGEGLLEQILNYKPKNVIIFSRDEFKQNEMKKKYGKYNNINFRIGYVQVFQDVLDACKNIDIVFHTAALKDVVTGETQPYEMINTNIHGTRNIIQAALKQNVSKVVNISTDKAASPSTVLGISKLAGERLISSVSQDQSSTVFCNVRFGNVFASRGSVIPVILEQIQRTGIITLTDPKMTRFIMTVDDATSLVLNAMAIAKGGETFVLKMKTVRIDLLFEATKKAVNKIIKKQDVKIQNRIIGARFGEKTHEEILTTEEVRHAIEDENFFIIDPQYDNQNKTLNSNWFSSKTSTSLTLDELSQMIETYLIQTHFCIQYKSSPQGTGKRTVL